MANRITIDVEARLVDGVSRNAEKISSSAGKANKELDKLGKKNVKPRLGAEDNAFTKKIREAQRKADKFGKTKASAVLGAIDKASSKIGAISSKASAFASKVYRGAMSVKDNASPIIGSITGAARSFAGKTFSAAVKIKDYATSTLSKIKNSLFSIKTLIGAITAGFAAKQLIGNPINLADAYSNAQIGFSTLLGESKGQAMMDEIDAFAKATPFKTSNVISNVQKMMAYGWDASKVIQDMETIGDAAAATGKGDEGLESIVYALSEIRSKGKLSTQELNQLASAGIKAKQYLAQGLGYGTDDAGMGKLMEDLEDGAIGANQAVELILKGMEEFNGMMDKTANETVEGLWGQITDTFEINIFRRWGQGLQDGARKGLGYVLELLDSNEDALENFGDLVHNIGKEIANWSADKLGKFVERVKEITSSTEFKDASLGGKIKLLWKGTVMDPLKEWWNSDAVQSWIDEKKEWLATKMEGWGESIGRGLSNGLLAILGVDVSGVIEEGADIGASFGRGFSRGFDGSAVTDALVDAISNVWGALPTWAKVLLGGYALGKTATGVGNLIGGIKNIAGLLSPVVGSTGTAMVKGTGLMNLLANAGYAMTGGAATTAMSGGMAASVGIGGLMAGASALKVGTDLVQAYKAYKADDATELKANLVSGGITAGGIGAGAFLGAKAGAGIGALFGGVGAVPGAIIGAGIGGIAGWISGEKSAEKIRENAAKTRFETEEMQKAVTDTELSAEELAAEFEKAVNSNIADHFGDLELSMDEIATLAQKIVIGDKADDMNKFSQAAATAANSLQTVQSAFDALDRQNWKTDLMLNTSKNGKISMDETAISEYKANVDALINSAKSYVEDKQYEFTASVSLLMDVTEGDGKTILSNGNVFYEQMQKQIEDLGSELSGKVDVALKDGVLTLDEQAEIVNLQEQIAKITNELAAAETEAEFEAIKIKFSEAHISEESFLLLQEELAAQLSESEVVLEDALVCSLTNLELQYKKGIISEEEYERLKGVLEESFEEQMEGLELKVNDIQIEVIAEAYEDVLGEDAAAKLQSAIEASLKEGISPAQWTTDDVRNFLNLPDLQEESAAAIATLLSNMEFEAGGTVNMNPEYNVTKKWEPENTTATQNVLVSMSPTYNLLKEWQPENTSVTQNAAVSINPAYSLLRTWTPPSMNKTIYPTITVNPSYVDKKGAPWKQNANGSIVQGKTLTWVGEEGPEAIIPLVPGRRARGLKLWEEAGRRLGVQYHAEGGIVGGGDSTPIRTYDREIPAGNGEQKIEVNMGGVVIEIKTDGNQSIVDSIEEQEEEIANKIATIFKNVFSAQFANTPAKGGT